MPLMHPRAHRRHLLCHLRYRRVLRGKPLAPTLAASVDVVGSPDLVRHLGGVGRPTVLLSPLLERDEPPDRRSSGKGLVGRRLAAKVPMLDTNECVSGDAAALKRHRPRSDLFGMAPAGGLLASADERGQRIPKSVSERRSHDDGTNRQVLLLAPAALLKRFKRQWRLTDGGNAVWAVDMETISDFTHDARNVDLLVRLEPSMRSRKQFLVNSERDL